MTSSDYEIDFEIEIVHNDRLIGKTLKAQVKYPSELTIRQDGIPTVGKLSSQLTVLYWIELSYATPIVAFGVFLWILREPGKNAANF